MTTSILPAFTATASRSLRARRLRYSLRRYGLEEILENGDLFAALLHMKIALAGNMNNNFFALARYLTDLGIDATLLLFPFETEHFLPHCDSYQPGDPVPIRRLSWSQAARSDPDWLSRDVAGFDFLFGCGLTAAFMARLGLDTDVYFPYGSDVFEVPFLWASVRDYEQSRDANRYVLGRWQREGLRRCRHFLLADQEFKVVLERLGVTGTIEEMFLPILYHRAYEGAALAEAFRRSPHTPAFQALRAAHDLVIFHHARQYWTDKTDTKHLKGNDVLLRGFAGFLAARPQVRACLVCFEYGSDVAASKELAQTLGIAGQVKWMPKMHRRDLMVGLSLCDIGTGYFDRGWRFGGVLVEVLCAGKPLIHNLGAYLETTRPEDVFDYVQARTADEIAAALADWLDRPGHYAEIGRRGREWFLQRSVDQTMRWCLEAFGSWARNRPGRLRRQQEEERRLTQQVAALNRELAGLQEDNRHAGRTIHALFGETPSLRPSQDLSWYMRAAQVGQRMLGDQSCEEIPSVLKERIRAAAARLINGDDEDRPAAWSPVLEEACRQGEVPAVPAAEAVAGAELAPALDRLAGGGGWRRFLLERLLRGLAGGPETVP